MAGGDFGPLMGSNADLVKGLLDKVNPDPTKDPYKPEQPIVYGADGNIQPPTNPYANLLSAVSMAPDQQKAQEVAAQQPGLLGMPMGGAPVIRMSSNTSQSAPSKKLRQQAFGRYR